MAIKYFLLPVFILSFCTANSQVTLDKDEEEEKKYTPYELLSSYYNTDFNPYEKGTYYFGFAMSLEDRQSENTENIFQKTIDGDKVNFDLLIKGGYYLNDYTMIGLNFNIYENKFEGVLFRDPDTLQSKTITRGFSITPNYRTSIPLTSNERLSFFTAVGLTLGKSNTLKREVKNLDEVDKTFSENYNLRLGISPGVTFFAMENFALEVQLDVLGYELNVENKTKNEIDESRDVRHNVDFKMNLLSLKVGLAYYIMNNKKR
ncbi:hypothetical protein [Aequorivita marina]|uniref:hypothetical protein n=1 Tax=Aequorivita marina TaxID=3073654 RepID=UPI0028766CE8|nr:hypothetical protein [Aequorivita sp. S2608]MDS1299148.1 hypothetical protein [Aequorivita sp. S2608]